MFSKYRIQSNKQMAYLLTVIQVRAVCMENKICFLFFTILLALFIFSHQLNIRYTSKNNSKPKLAISVQLFSSFSETTKVNSFLYIRLDDSTTLRCGCMDEEYQCSRKLRFRHYYLWLYLQGLEGHMNGIRGITTHITESKIHISYSKTTIRHYCSIIFTCNNFQI